MPEEKLLRWDGAGGVDHELFALGEGLLEERGDVGEEGGFQLARVVAALPEVALQGLEIGDLYIAGD